ncbi:hypothetical protein DY000_02045473 [Brassica cretica]|uniref:Defective in cullin neddylation protein n=1 Tax=Brassica cretica TaxID=69181 RepID=A0ABQ7F653_BRACR|nr:hypothetical protein DY000_02045473 [Brassica cretica]
MRRSAASLKKKSDSITSSTTDLFRSASSKATTKEMDRIDHLFNQYANTSSNLIDPEGIEELCSNLEVPHTDIRILMLAWKMKSEKQGYFTQEEWRRGLKALRADTLNKLKKALPELEKEVRRQSNFADFYAYAFRYCLTEEKQKSIDIETICQLLEIVMGSTFRPQVDYFVEYLKIQNDYKVINMDQWMGFYRFCNEISFPEMTEYNPELAWPLVLDNFVEWIRLLRWFAEDLNGIRGLEIDKHVSITVEIVTGNAKTVDEQSRRRMLIDLSSWHSTCPTPVRRQSNFADFYAYAFRYCLTEEKQKNIDIETMCQLLEIVMGYTFRAQVDYFVEYLKVYVREQQDLSLPHHANKQFRGIH